MQRVSRLRQFVSDCELEVVTFLVQVGRVNRGNLGKTGKSDIMGNHYTQRIILQQSICSLPTNVAASVN